MISQRQFLKENWYSPLRNVVATLSLVTGVIAYFEEGGAAVACWVLAVAMLGWAAIIQWQAEAAYQRYVDSVNKNPNDDLR